ncbi:hypothetical protein EDC04DRAFT_2597882 [Pisolithus marmoratus]|nr:hypothetical protein EDC04DRAFT_2597882 [Pisolithus marmoratus]
MSEHRVSSVANSMSHPLTEDVQEAPMADRQINQYTSCPWTLCLHTSPEGWECLELINCGTAPDHFKDPVKWSWSVCGRVVGAGLYGTTTSVTYASITFDTIGCLLTQIRLSYARENELFKPSGGFGSMTAMELDSATLSLPFPYT